MKPTKPFLFCLVALAAIGAAVILPVYTVREAAAQSAMPLSTALTPTMIDFFGLSDAFDRPSIAALVQCRATPTCSETDSSRVRFFDAKGAEMLSYDEKPTTTIERVRRHRSTLANGSGESRMAVRRYSKDAQGRLVMNGIDSVVTTEIAIAGSKSVVRTSIRRYNDVRYLLNDPAFVWPMTGLVVLELSENAVPTRASVRPASHAAVSFDGTQYAHVLTTGALTHRVNMQAKRLETTMPDR